MMRDMLSRRQFVRATGVSAASLGLAACSGAGEEADSEAGTDSGSAELAKLTFCLDYTPNTNHTGIYVANALGYFAEEGIELKIVQPAEDGAEAMVGTGRAELGVSYQDYLADAYAGGNTGLFAIAAILQHNTSGIMSRGGLGVTHPAAMEGLRYATWELPVEQATVRQVVEADGGDFDAIKLVPYTVDDDVAGIRADMYDCVWVFEGWAVQNAKVQDVDVDFFSFISIDETFDLYSPVLVANIAFAEENPDLVRAFVRAARRGYEYTIAHPEEAGEMLLEAVPELDAALVAESLGYLGDQFQADAPAWGVIDGARWARFYQWLNDNELVTPQLDVNAGWTDAYLDADA